jgi:hypothetical protein
VLGEKLGKDFARENLQSGCRKGIAETKRANQRDKLQIVAVFGRKPRRQYPSTSIYIPPKRRKDTVS